MNFVDYEHIKTKENIFFCEYDKEEK